MSAMRAARLGRDSIERPSANPMRKALSYRHRVHCPRRPRRIRPLPRPPWRRPRHAPRRRRARLSPRHPVGEAREGRGSPGEPGRSRIHSRDASRRLGGTLQVRARQRRRHLLAGALPGRKGAARLRPRPGQCLGPALHVPAANRFRQGDCARRSNGGARHGRTQAAQEGRAQGERRRAPIPLPRHRRGRGRRTRRAARHFDRRRPQDHALDLPAGAGRSRHDHDADLPVRSADRGRAQARPGAMSPMGRPEGECRSAQHEGGPGSEFAVGCR